jgi:LAS superfamily LD-carboxypeptidase LdcB
MAKKAESPAQEPQQVTMSMRYENTDTQFASQFIVNASREEIIVNFSPGAIADPKTNQQLLPINTRIAMTPHGAARLAQTLSNALKNMQAAAQPKGATDDDKSDSLN